MRRDELYLRGNVQAASDVQILIAGQSNNTFHEDKIIRSPVLFILTVIGKDTSQLSKPFKKRYNEAD